MLGKLHRCLCFLGLSAALLGGRMAAADPLGQDPVVLRCTVEAAELCLVTMRSGAQFAGRLTGMHPGAEIRMQLPTNEERVLPWFEVLSAIPAPLAPFPTSAASPPLSAPPVPAVVEGLTSTMHLEQRPANFEPEAQWATLCLAPCPSLGLRQGYEYRVLDESWTGSASFELSQSSGPLRLRVRPGRAGMRRAGVALLIVGSVLTTVGGVLYLSSQSQSGGLPISSQDGLLSLGILGGIGLPTLGIGIALFVVGSTHVTLTPAIPFP